MRSWIWQNKMLPYTIGAVIGAWIGILAYHLFPIL